MVIELLSCLSQLPIGGWLPQVNKGMGRHSGCRTLCTVSILWGAWDASVLPLPNQIIRMNLNTWYYPETLGHWDSGACVRRKGVIFWCGSERTETWASIFSLKKVSRRLQLLPFQKENSILQFLLPPSVHIHRSARCLLTYYGQGSTLQVPALCVQRQTLSIRALLEPTSRLYYTVAHQMLLRSQGMKAAALPIFAHPNN